MGIRRKLKLDAVKVGGGTTSGSAKVLKTLFKKGRSSAPDIQSAASTIQDGGDHTDGIRRLAKSGAKGAVRGNMSRDVMGCLTRDTSAPDVYVTTIPMWDADLDKKINEDVHIMLPYEVLDNKTGEGVTHLNGAACPTNPHM